MWDLSSPARHRTHVPCIGRQILNHWCSREVPHHSSLESSISPSPLHFLVVYTCSLISPALKYMKASPDSTLLLISTLYLSFHQWQISWNMSLFPILPSILSSLGIYIWRLEASGNMLVEVGHFVKILITVSFWLKIWTLHLAKLHPLIYRYIEGICVCVLNVKF